MQEYTDIALSAEDADNFWRWLHDSGELRALNAWLASAPEEPSQGRNDPCFCGSGKKYKRCHGGGYE